MWQAAGWAVAMATSRAFALHGPQQPQALLPLIDTGNHSFQPNSKVVRGDDGAADLLALQSIDQGSEITMSYGAVNNANLLLNYGFVDASNPHDHIMVPLNVDALQVRWRSGCSRRQLHSSAPIDGCSRLTSVCWLPLHYNL